MLGLNDDCIKHVIDWGSIRSLVNLSRTYRALHDWIMLEFDERIHAIMSNKNSSAENISFTDMYMEYNNGKSYYEWGNEPTPQDIPFSLRDSEYILCNMEITALFIGGPGRIVITINRNLAYTLYEFHHEIDIDESGTPDYYGYEDEDKQALSLLNKSTHHSIAEMMHALSTCNVPSDVEKRERKRIGNGDAYDDIYHYRSMFNTKNNMMSYDTDMMPVTYSIAITLAST